MPVDRSISRLFATVVAALVVAIGVIAAPSRADAFSNYSPPFTGATDFVTNFPSSGVGPVGLLFAGGSFFATDYVNNSTYRFAASGGSAASPQAQLPNGLTGGLAFQQNVYYGINQFSGLFRFDPSTLLTTFVVGGIPAYVRAVVADPLSGDLYISSSGGIYRVQNPATAPIVTVFVNHGDYDGLAFTADGTRLYGANIATGAAEGYTRTGSLVFNVFVGHGMDGIAVALPGAMVNGVNLSNNVFTNSNDGTIERIDTNNGNVVSVVAMGGTRGDFVTVGPDGCLYVTQSDRIQKLSPCFFQSTGPTDIKLAPVSATNPVGTSHTLTATVTTSTGAPVAGVTVTFKVSSGPNVGKTGTALTDISGVATFTYSDTGGAGTDTIVATFADSAGTVHQSNDATKVWMATTTTTTTTGGTATGGTTGGATPELDSLLLFGSGLSGLGAYALMRVRARRRR